MQNRRFWLLCGATLFEFTALGTFLATLPLFVTNELDGSRAQVGLAVGCFSISAVLFRPFVGRQLDRRGRKLFLCAAPVILLVTTGGLAVQHALVAVIALRLAQGVAGACFYTAAAAVATDMAPDEERASYIARFSVFLYGGFATGPALAELLIRRGGFGWAWAAAALCAAGALGFGLAVPETLTAPAPKPTGRRRIVHPAAIGPGVVLCTSAMGYTAITSFSPLYARQVGMGSSGLLYAAFAVTVLLVRLVSGRLADNYGRVEVAFPGLVLGATGMFLLAGFHVPATALAGVSLFGAGFAMLFPALMALAVDRAPDNERGEALGSFTAFFDVGASTGGYIVGAVADRAGYGAAFGVPGGLCLVGLAVLARLGGKVRAEAREAARQSGLPEPAGT